MGSTMTLKNIMTDAEAAALKGKQIGTGVSRRVFEVLGYPDLVVKEMINESPGSNVMEWRIWGWVKGTDLEPVFAECVAVTYSHRYLFMRRATKPDDSHFLAAPKLPVWHDDPKPDAFGVIDGVLKIIDYGNVKQAEFSKALVSSDRQWNTRTANLRVREQLKRPSDDDAR